jgi:hypothetical protein
MLEVIFSGYANRPTRVAVSAALLARGGQPPLRCKALDRSASVYLFNKCYRILALENHTVLTASITDSLLLASRLHPTVAYTGSIRIKSAIRLLRQTKNNSAQSIARRFAVYWSVIHDIDPPSAQRTKNCWEFLLPPGNSN